MNFKLPPKGVSAPSSYFNMDWDKKMKAIKDTYDKYKQVFAFSSQSSRVPESVLLAFAIAASNGDAWAGLKDSNKRGIMMWDKRFARQVLENEAAQGRLSPAEINFLKQSKITIANNKANRDITTSDQLDARLSIFIASIILGQLFDEKWANDQAGLRMDKVAAVYYGGINSNAGKSATSISHPTIADYVKTLDGDTKSFVSKIIGQGGALHLIKDDFPNIK